MSKRGRRRYLTSWPRSRRQGTAGAGATVGAVSTELRADVLVVGAGPAGSAAAITAASRGLDVLIIDKATFPRDKTCGDGLTTGALRHLERLGLHLSALPSYTPVREAMIASPSGRLLTLPLPADGERAGVVPRAELDAALVAVARERGARVVEGAELVEVKSTGTGTGAGAEAVLANGRTVRARRVIAADGHYSAVRRTLDPDRPPKLGEWHAFRQYFHGVADRRLWVLFEDDLLPGYAWVFPLPDGRANVGVGVFRGPGVTGRALKQKWQDVLARPAIRRVLGERAEPEDRHRAWPVPSRLDLDSLARGPVLFVGDAAGVVDPLTGEGIAQALETGILAAESVARGGDVEGRYRAAVRASLAADLRLASWVQRLLAHPKAARAALRAVDRSARTRRSFARWMFEDYPRALLLTPSRWRRGMFTDPGAYRHARFA